MKARKNVVTEHVKFSTQNKKKNTLRIIVKNVRNSFTKLLQDISYS